MVIGGGVQHGSTSRVTSVPTQKGQRVLPHVSFPVAPFRCAAVTGRRGLGEKLSGPGGGGDWFGSEGDFNVIIRYSVMIEIFFPSVLNCNYMKT